MVAIKRSIKSLLFAFLKFLSMTDFNCCIMKMFIIVMYEFVIWLFVRLFVGGYDPCFIYDFEFSFVIFQSISISYCLFDFITCGYGNLRTI